MKCLFWLTKKQFSGYAAKKGIVNSPFNKNAPKTLPLKKAIL